LEVKDFPLLIRKRPGAFHKMNNPDMSLNDSKENLGADVAPIPQSTVTQSQVSETAEKVSRFIIGYESTMQNLLTEQQSRLASFSANYDRKTQNLQNDHQKKMSFIQEKMRSKTNEINRSISSINQSFEKIKESAESHLARQNVSLPLESITTLGLTGTPLSPRSNALEVANEHMAAGNQILQNLTKAEMPKNLSRIIIGGLIAGFVIGACSGISNGSFFPVFLVISGAGCGIAFLMSQSAKSNMHGLYNSLMSHKDSAKQNLEVYFQQLQPFVANCESEAKIAATEFKVAKTKLYEERQKNESALKADFNEKISAFVNQSRIDAESLQEDCRKLYKESGFAGIDWKDDLWRQWQSADSFCPAVSVGTITASSRCESFTKDIDQNFLQQLQEDTGFKDLPLKFRLPAMMSLSNGCGLMFYTAGDEKLLTLNVVRSVMMRLLANQLPGTVRFTMLDPIAQGGNFGAFMPLKKYDEKLIASRIWSEPNHIEEQLSRITERMSEIIQMRLRNEHVSIEEYNRKAKVPEPYEFVVVADFPANFSDTAARRLVSIAQNGPRCGVYPVIVVDKNLKLPYNFDLKSLAQFTGAIGHQNENYSYPNENYHRWSFNFSEQQLDLNNEDDKILANQIINATGKNAAKVMKVEVPFDDLLEMEGLSEANFWTGSTADKIEVPLGPHNVEDSQKLVFGEGAAHHAVVVGKTGMGKTNLMDIIITTLALKYSPREIQFYLIDLKKGVGFKPYANAQLPHARVIAIDSEREFALSVLRGLVEEMDKRGDKFREFSKDAIEIDEVKDYRKHTGKDMPRILLVVDEFQNLFLEDDSIGRDSATILDRLVREGRSFGIHVLLGSQSLAGKSSQISGSTLGQIGIRIALSCNESDARQIMADDNVDAKYLSRPGEAIYNDRNGLIEGNKRFQVALFKDDVRQKYLQKIADKNRIEDKKPIVFEGNKLAQFEDCTLFRKFLSGETPPNPKRIEAWIGEPIALRDSTTVRFRKQGGSNLLVVAKEEFEGVGILSSAWLSLAAQHRPDAADFFVLNLTNAEESWHELVEEIGTMIPHETHVFGRRDLTKNLQILEAEIKARAEDSKGDGKTKYLFLFGLQRAKDLRFEEGFSSRYSYSDEEKEPNAPEIFAKILREGAEAGIHVLAWCDLAGNAKKAIDRKSINEFGFRCATAMGQDDSQFVLDSPAASKLDRPHRAVFYDEDRPGHLEKFRPFAIPADRKWLQQTTASLRAFHAKAQAA
jgi:hypothetical protein